MELISDGWVKKYVLTYLMPDGRTHTYDMASRKNPDDLRALLEGNASGVRPQGADAVCAGAAPPPHRGQLAARENAIAERHSAIRAAFNRRTLA